MDTAFLGTLACPYCRGALELIDRAVGDDTSVVAGIVRCACYQYPIVDGILLMRQTSPPAETTEVAVDALRAGDVEGARRHLLHSATMVDLPREPVRSARHLARSLTATLRRQVERRRGAAAPTRFDTAFRLDLDRLRPSGFADYLYYRYANPSFVASVPLMSVLESVRPSSFGGTGYVLDLGCGVGHSTAMMGALFPDLSYVAADPDFVNLELLRRHVAPDALCVCLDAQLPLPFADDQFAALFCLDAFHYIRAKWSLARELDRVVDGEGVFLLPHLHNAAFTNVSPGIPLRGEDYLRMFEFLDAVLLDEAQVLDRYMAQHALELPSPTTAPIPAAPVFSMVGSRRQDVWRTYETGHRRARHLGSLAPNPIYDVTEASESTLQLRLRWPDAWLGRECAPIERYLPAETTLDRGLMDRLAGDRPTEADAATAAALADAWVLVHLAPGYLAAPGSEGDRRST